MARNPKHDILLEPIGFGPKTSRNPFWQTSHCTVYGSERPGTQAREVPRGASGLPSNVFPERAVYDATADEDDIKAIVNMYVLAAQRAEQAGFDIVEVTGSDSTLPMQFLERRYNRRTDRYGGSLANRSRFYIAVIAALKNAVRDPLAVTTRFQTDTINSEFRVQHHDEGLHFIDLMHREGVCDLWAVKI